MAQGTARACSPLCFCARFHAGEFSDVDGSFYEGDWRMGVRSGEGNSAHSNPISKQAGPTAASKHNSRNACGDADSGARALIVS